MKRKIGLYFLSLWLMFFLILIITIKIPYCFSGDWIYVGTLNLLKTNTIPFLCLLSMSVSFFSFLDFRYKVKGTSELPFKVTEIDNIDYEHLTFLTTYIVPLVCFNFENVRYQIVLLLLLVIIGIIYIRTDLFYANPTLALLKFRIYRVSGQFVNDERKNVILITRDKIELNNNVKYIKLDNRIYYAKKVN